MSRSVKTWKCTSSGNEEVDYLLQLARLAVPEELKKNYYTDNNTIGWTYILDDDLKWIAAVQNSPHWDWDVCGILRRVWSSGTLENEFMDEVFRQQSALAKEEGFQRMFVGTHKNVRRYFMSQMDRWSALTGDNWQCDGRRYNVHWTPQIVAWTGDCPHEPILD